MEYYVKSVVPIIESNYDNLSAVERIIADFFISNKENMDFASKSIAKHLYVSEASLSRFAKKCGFRGYRDFIYQYEETFEVRANTTNDNVKMVLDAYQELLNKSYNLLDEYQVKRVAKMLNRAGRVFVVGKGSSGMAATEMELRFMRMGMDIRASSDRDMMRMQIVLLNSSSLAIGISISGESDDVIYFLKQARKAGGKAIIITARKNESYKEFCDEVILIPSLKHLNHGNVISPQFPILVMTDIILSFYIKQDASVKESIHDHTLQALRD